MKLLADTIVTRRWAVLALAVLSTVIAVFAATSLRFEANYLNLIPEDVPEVWAHAPAAPTSPARWS